MLGEYIIFKCQQLRLHKAELSKAMYNRYKDTHLYVSRITLRSQKQGNIVIFVFRIIRNNFRMKQLLQCLISLHFVNIQKINMWGVGIKACIIHMIIVYGKQGSTRYDSHSFSISRSSISFALTKLNYNIVCSRMGRNETKNLAFSYCNRFANINFFVVITFPLSKVILFYQYTIIYVYTYI